MFTMCFLKTLILIFSLSYSCGFDLSESDIELILNPYILNVIKKNGYDGGSISLINGALELLQDFPNITIIGSQNIYDLEGKLVEVRSVEISLPNYLHNHTVSSAVKNSSLNVTDITSLGILKEDFDLYFQAGLNIEMAAEAYNDNAELTNFVYLDHKNHFALLDGLYVKGYTSVIEEVQEQVEQMQNQSSNLISVLKYDAENNFLASESTVAAGQFAHIISFEGDVDRELIDGILEALTLPCITYTNRTTIINELLTSLLITLPNIDFYLYANIPKYRFTQRNFTLITECELLNKKENKLTLTIDGLYKKDNISYVEI